MLYLMEFILDSFGNTWPRIRCNARALSNLSGWDLALGGAKGWLRPMRKHQAPYFCSLQRAISQFTMESSTSSNCNVSKSIENFANGRADKKRGEFSIESLLLTKGNHNMETMQSKSFSLVLAYKKLYQRPCSDIKDKGFLTG